MVKKMEEEKNNGLLKFSGEYQNDQRNGYGTEYYQNGKVKFDGEFINGVKNKKKKKKK